MIMKTNKKSNLFLDTVVIDEIRKYSWLISGVTTTPTFFKRENINYDTFVSDFREKFSNLELHIEVLGPTPKETEKKLLEIIRKDWFNSEKVVIKIPVDFDNLQIISKYSKKGIKFNTHLVFNTCQAYFAAISGTTYICSLIGRYADNMSRFTIDNLRGGENDVGKKLLTDIIEVVNKYPTNQSIKVMASSIRTVEDLQNSISAGADVVTVSPKILEESIQHEYTKSGTKTFLKDMGY